MGKVIQCALAHLKHIKNIKLVGNFALHHITAHYVAICISTVREASQNLMWTHYKDTLMAPWGRAHSSAGENACLASGGSSPSRSR